MAARWHDGGRLGYNRHRDGIAPECGSGEHAARSRRQYEAPAPAPRTSLSSRTGASLRSVAAPIVFPHAAQAIQVTRRTRRNGSRKWKTETSYACSKTISNGQ
jgi:hypothetical protein